MLNQVKRAIEPTLTLHAVIDRWHDIARCLAEAPRKRKSQVSKIELQAKKVSVYGAVPWENGSSQKGKSIYLVFSTLIDQ